MSGARTADASTPRPETGSIRPKDGVRAAAPGIARIAFALWLFGAAAFGQSEWQVDVLIPETLSVRLPAEEIAFGITHETYPPDSFPALYPATIPEGGVLPVEVFSSAAGGWSLLLEIPDLVDAAGRGVIRADQVLYRVDGGLWSRGSPLPQVIYSSVGPTGDWLEVDIEFQLELIGTESPGSYSVVTRLTALGDGQTP